MAYSNSWFCSDHHLGHTNIITFEDNQGQLIRPFSSLEEMHETIVERHNSVVGQYDRVYFLGDVAINKGGLKVLERMNGKKVLIKGNHDIFKLKDYTPYFEDIRAYKVFPKHGIICSHIPIHPSQLERRFVLNVHGHTHQNYVQHPSYLNVCMEPRNYTPVDLNFLSNEAETAGAIRNGTYF